MGTPVKNKVSEVMAWIERHAPPEPSPQSVKRYIDERWPVLDPEIRYDIYIAALAGTF